MGFEQVEEKQVVRPFPSRITNRDIGNRHLPNALFDGEGRPVSGKIEETARFCEPRQLLRLEPSLQLGQYEGPHVVDVYPGTKDGQCKRLIQLGNGFAQFKRTDSHSRPSLGALLFFRSIIVQTCSHENRFEAPRPRETACPGCALPFLRAFLRKRKRIGNPPAKISRAPLLCGKDANKSRKSCFREYARRVLRSDPHLIAVLHRAHSMGFES